MKKKGFTMAELLIVVAIIAVLVAISIPVFISQLEQSREATDLANVRNAYGAVMQAVLGNPSKLETTTSGGVISATVELKQKQTGWQTELPIRIGEIKYNGEDDNPNWVGTPGEGGTCTITYTKENGIIFNWSDNAPPQINYDSVQSVGDYILYQIRDQLAKYKDGESVDLGNAFKQANAIAKSTLTLPNGQEVSVIVFNRPYNEFEDIKTRLTTANTASLIYNKDSGELSTIVYYDGKNYSSWTVGGDWKENSYDVKKH